MAWFRLATVAVDSTGTFEEPPIWVVAFRHVDVQKDKAYYLSENACKIYKQRIDVDYREKVSAAFIFKAMQNIPIKECDAIEIDKDFLGHRQERVKRYLWKLFGRCFYGTLLEKPPIEFFTVRCKEGANVKVAHKKSRWAREKDPRIRVKECPNLQNLLDILEG